MLSKFTIIGLVVGSVIIGIGAISLIDSIGIQVIVVDETLTVGESTAFQIRADQGAVQTMNILGEKFNLALQSPGDGLQIPMTSYNDKESFEWTHASDGVTYINIQNTGSTDLDIVSTFNVTTDPILFTFHIMVITAGVVIIGFSSGFTLRKPKGF